MKNKWIDRVALTHPFYLTLCTTEKQFQRELRRLRVRLDDYPPFVPAEADACVHKLEKGDGKKLAIVAIRHDPKADPVAVAALLTHEAVHLWQWWRDAFLRERNPSIELEAYAIQSFTQKLLTEYRRQCYPT